MSYCGLTPGLADLDTNVLLTAVRSRRGAAFRLLSLGGRSKLDISLSVPPVLEHEDASLPRTPALPLTVATFVAPRLFRCHRARRSRGSRWRICMTKPAAVI